MCHAWAMGRKDSKVLGWSLLMPGRVAPGTSHSFKALRDLESALMLRDQPRLLTSRGHSPDRDVWEEKKLGEGEVTPRGLRRGRIEEERDGDGVGSMRNEEGDNLSLRSGNNAQPNPT